MACKGSGVQIPSAPPRRDLMGRRLLGGDVVGWGPFSFLPGGCGAGWGMAHCPGWWRPEKVQIPSAPPRRLASPAGAGEAARRAGGGCRARGDYVPPARRRRCRVGAVLLSAWGLGRGLGGWPTALGGGGRRRFNPLSSTRAGLSRAPQAPSGGIPARRRASALCPSRSACRAITTRWAWGDPAPWRDSVR